MICRNCNTEVGSANYCPHCGAQVSVQYCAYCGTALPAGARNCPHCGRSCAPAVGPAVSPAVGAGRAAGAAYDTPPARKQLQSRKQKDGDTRTGFHSFICLVCGIAGLILLGVITYNMLMGNLFVSQAGVIDPLKAVPVDSFAVIPGYESFIAYFNNLYEMLSSLFSNSELEIYGKIASVFSLVPQFLIVLSILVAVLITCIGTFVAVFRFIGGMCSKKFFTLVKPLAWVLSAQLMMYTACVFGGVSGWTSMSSGVALNTLLAAGGIAICIIGNVMFAGKRFFTGGSIMKWLSNAGILAGALVALFAFPMAISSEFAGLETGANESLGYVIANIGNATFTMPDFVFYAIVLVITVKLLFSLPRFVRKTASRLGTTFKFDGYEDTGFVGKSFVYLIGLLMLAVPAIVFINMYAAGSLTVNQGLYVFIAGGAITVVSAIINRVFLNSDQQ